MKRRCRDCQPWDRIRIPVLGVWSDEDPFLLEPQMTLSAAVVEAPWRYERISGAGHWMMLDQPEALNRLLIEFLTSISLACWQHVRLTWSFRPAGPENGLHKDTNCAVGAHLAAFDGPGTVVLYFQCGFCASAETDTW